MEVVIIVILIIFLSSLYHKNKQYKEGAYYQITKNSYSSVKYDKGRHAEYLTYVSLRHFENNGGKFLFNIFIPKGNNKATEVDVLLICQKGLFVLNAKITVVGFLVMKHKKIGRKHYRKVGVVAIKNIFITP